MIEANTEIIYIGQSLDMRNRWRGVQHKVYRAFAGLPFVRIAWLEVSASDPFWATKLRLDELEKRLIMRFNPRLNGAPDKPVRKGSAK